VPGHSHTHTPVCHRVLEREGDFITWCLLATRRRPFYPSVEVAPQLNPALLPQAKSYGPILSGALFGAGWWFWVDAVVCSSSKVPADQVRCWHTLQQTLALAQLRPLLWLLASLMGPDRTAVYDLQYVPGIVATLALIMINCIRRCVGGCFGAVCSCAAAIPPPTLKLLRPHLFLRHCSLVDGPA
jgi:hypothetical protein